MRPLLKMDTAQVRGGGQYGDGVRTRASSNLNIDKRKKKNKKQNCYLTQTWSTIFEDWAQFKFEHDFI